MNPTTLLAENHIRITRALFDEGMRAASGKAYQKAVKKLAVCLLILYLAVAAWVIYTKGPLLILAGETIFLGALLFWLTVMLPGTKRRSKYKAMSQGGSTIPERTVRFYQDHLSVRAEGGKETMISYQDVEDYEETPNLYLLHCKGNVCVLLDKNGFVTGSFQDVAGNLAAAFRR